MDDKLKETLYIAYTEVFDKAGKLIDAIKGSELNVDVLKKLVARKTLYEVIKQAGMLEDYTRWLMHRSAANEDKAN